MRISVIKDAGNSQGTRIFAGVYGATNEQGQFRIDPSLKSVAYLFTLLESPAARQTPALSGLTLDGSDMMHLDVPDPAAPFVKGVLLNAMTQRWSGMYQNTLGNMRLTGITAQALANEEANTVFNSQQVLKDAGLSLFEVPVTMKASSAHPISLLTSYSLLEGDETVESLTHEILPDLRTLAQTEEQIGQIKDLGQDALGKSPAQMDRQRAEQAANAALQNLAAPQAPAPTNPEPAADVTEIDLSELQLDAPATPPPGFIVPAEASAQAPRAVPFEGGLLAALAAAGINPSSAHQLDVDVNAVLYIPAKNALEAAQMVGLLRSLAEQVNDPMFTSILTPIPKSMQNAREGQIPVYELSQNDNQDGDVYGDRP